MLQNLNNGFSLNIDTYLKPKFNKVHEKFSPNFQFWSQRVTCWTLIYGILLQLEIKTLSTLAWDLSTEMRQPVPPTIREAIWPDFPPGAAHMSRTKSFGSGLRMCVHASDGKFWAKNILEGKDSKEGNFWFCIFTATPLQTTFRPGIGELDVHVLNKIFQLKTGRLYLEPNLTENLE